MMASKSEALPQDTVLSYLAEGAANVVYRISFSPRTSTPEPSVVEEYGDETPPPSLIEDNLIPLWETIFHEKLVRFRKNLSTTAPCALAQASWERLIKPLFPTHQLVDQSLVKLQPCVIARLNDELRSWELGKNALKGSSDLRPTKRQGIYLADDEHALLVTDMTPHNGEELIEFKPKWLIQSPSAPRNSKRCRQCARIARTNAERARNRDHPMDSFCPLDLTSEKPEEIYHAAKLIMQPGASDNQISRFAQWLGDTDILDILKARQSDLDAVGVINGDADNERLLAAMTLRDCTMFVKSTSSDPREWDARIGDLDLKSKDKIDYWRGVEKQLIDEGWYQGAENREIRQPLVCRLSRGSVLR